MKRTIIVQGKKITYKDIEFIQQMIDVNPSWNRTRLSRELCILWNWYATNGQIKDMASRNFLLKLERCGYISFPPRQRSSGGNRKRAPIPFMFHIRLLPLFATLVVLLLYVSN